MTVVSIEPFGTLGDAPTLPIPVIVRNDPSTRRVPVQPAARVLPGPTARAGSDSRQPGPRQPAALALRFSVWLLSLVFCLAVLGDVGIWLQPGRFPHNEPLVAAAATTPEQASGHPAASTFGLVSNSPETTTYSVPSANYVVGVLVDQRCWVDITAPGGPVLAKVLGASKAIQWFPVSGRSTVEVAARTLRLTVASQGKTLGSIPTPIVGHRYVFAPAAS